MKGGLCEVRDCGVEHCGPKKDAEPKMRVTNSQEKGRRAQLSPAAPGTVSMGVGS